MKRALELAVAAICLVPTIAHALEVNARAGYQAEYSNNSGQTSNDEVGEWIQTPELAVDANHKGPSTSLEVDYRARREIHQKSDSLDETIVDGIARATWQAITDRLAFSASNVRTQTTIDSRGTDVQSNLQVTNTAEAGGTLSIDSFSNHQLQLGYTFTDLNADETNTDSQSNTGTFAYIVPLDPSQQMRLSARVSDVNFESSSATDFISREGDVQYTKSTDELDLNLSIGYTVFDMDAQDDSKGTTGAASLDWHASGTTEVRASYSRSIESGALDAQSGIPTFGQAFNDDNSDLTQPYTADQANLTVDTKLGHNDIELTGYYRRQNYDGIDRNQETTGGIIGVSRKLRPTLTAHLFGDLSKTDFEDQGQRNDDLRAIFALEWERWRRLAVTASTTYTKRDSNLPGAEFEEWKGAVTFMYSFLGKSK